MEFSQVISENEVIIRLAFFFGVFGVVALWELTAPRRFLTTSKTVRWANNLFSRRFAPPCRGRPINRREWGQNSES